MSQFVKFAPGQNKLMPSLQTKKCKFSHVKKGRKKQIEENIYMTVKIVWLENLCPFWTLREKVFLAFVANRIKVKENFG